MSAEATSVAPEAPTPDEAQGVSFGTVVRRRWEALKQGDVGSLPVIIALVIIVAFFYSKNSNYLSAGNFTNLLTQMAGVTTVAIGVVFVLLLGEIDLSIGYVSGVAGVVVAEMQLPNGRFEVKYGLVAIIVAVLVTTLIGAFQGSWVAYLGVPSFVVTLAGYLFWQGVILQTIGDTGVIVIQNNTINNVANYFFSDTAGWIIAFIAFGLFALSTLVGVIGRRRHQIYSDNLVVVVL